jgi:hypothetical protein
MGHGIFEMRAFDRDLIRGGHYGQRSCVPRKQAEHMAAPTNAASEDSPCQPGAVHTWPIATFPCAAKCGHFRGIADMVTLVARSTLVANDPEPTCAKLQGPIPILARLQMMDRLVPD